MMTASCNWCGSPSRLRGSMVTLEAVVWLTAARVVVRDVVRVVRNDQNLLTHMSATGGGGQEQRSGQQQSVAAAASSSITLPPPRSTVGVPLEYRFIIARRRSPHAVAPSSGGPICVYFYRSSLLIDETLLLLY